MTLALILAASIAASPPAPRHDLHILADGKVRMDDGPEIGLSELHAKLQKVCAEKPKPNLHIEPDRMAKYDTVAVVLKELQQFGFRIGFTGIEKPE